MTPTDVIRRGADLIFAEVDGEAVALSAERGVCYGLDGVGLRVLQLIDPPTTIAEVCRRLTTEYDVDEATCETDVVDLLENLKTEGLVTVEQDSQTR